jgi:HSP20 family protein
MNALLNSTIARRTPLFATTDLSEIFDALAGTAGAVMHAPSMPIDVIEREDGIVVHANVPGFAKDDVTVEFHEGVLTIAAQRSKDACVTECKPGCCGEAQGKPKQSADGKGRVVVRERSFSNVRRSIAMPERVTGDGIVAELSDWVLTVTLPYAARPEPRRIDVN